MTATEQTQSPTPPAAKAQGPAQPGGGVGHQARGVRPTPADLKAWPARAARFLVTLLRHLFGTLRDTAVRVVNFCETWLLEGKKAEHGLAVTRIVFGVVGAGLLLTNWSTRLYAFGPGSAWNGEFLAPVSDFPKMWLFSSFHAASMNAAVYTTLYVALFALAVLVILGWRFKLVLPVYFIGWVSFIEANDMLGDQGDNMYRIALILLFFTDPVRVWALDAKRRARAAAVPAARRGSWPARVWRGEPLCAARPEVGSLFNNLALVALTAQVCFVYASGALYKAGGTPWQEGWAVYSPLHTVQFGTWPELSTLVTTWGPAVAIASWGSIVLQMSFPFMLLSHPTRVVGLVGIMGFHVGIAVLMGLPWFSLTMIAIDFVFITERSWGRVIATSRGLWRRAG